MDPCRTGRVPPGREGACPWSVVVRAATLGHREPTAPSSVTGASRHHRPREVSEVRDDRDLLHVLAHEHRDLTASSRRLRQGRRAQARDGVPRAATRIVEHELVHRLLVHPLLRRDQWGRRLLADRREEQVLVADRLRRVLRHPSIAVRPATWGHGTVGVHRSTTDPIAALDLQLVEHTDREEILEFPHVRHVAGADELAALGDVRRRLRPVLLDRLRGSDSLVADGGWASTSRLELPGLLELPDDLVVVLPDLSGTTDAAVLH